MKKIIPISKPEIGEKEKKNVLKCLKSGWIFGAIPYGGYIEKFEKSLTNYLGVLVLAQMRQIYQAI